MKSSIIAGLTRPCAEKGGCGKTRSGTSTLKHATSGVQIKKLFEYEFDSLEIIRKVNEIIDILNAQSDVKKHKGKRGKNK